MAGSERRRRFYQDHLERRPHVGLEEMSAQGGAVEAAHNDMGVNSRFAVLVRDVSDEGQDLDLLVDAEPPVLAPGNVEEAQHGRPQSPDPREVGARNGSYLREVGEAPGHLLPRSKDHRQALLPL